MRVTMRSLLWVLCGVVLGLGAAQSASATTVTVVMTGIWSQVDDTAGVLDGSVAVGSAFTATFTYDDQTPDCEPFNGLGCYLMNGSAGSLTFATGNYSFVDEGIANNGLSTENDFQGQDIVALFFDRYRISGPLPVGVALAPLAYANPSLVDYSRTALSSDRLLDVVWDANLYDTDFYFFGPVTNRGATDYIEFGGAIASMTVTLPEPAGAALVSAGLVSLALLRRRHL